MPRHYNEEPWFNWERNFSCSVANFGVASTDRRIRSNKTVYIILLLFLWYFFFCMNHIEFQLHNFVLYCGFAWLLVLGKITTTYFLYWITFLVSSSVEWGCLRQVFVNFLQFAAYILLIGRLPKCACQPPTNIFFVLFLGKCEILRCVFEVCAVHLANIHHRTGRRNNFNGKCNGQVAVAWLMPYGVELCVLVFFFWQTNNNNKNNSQLLFQSSWQSEKINNNKIILFERNRIRSPY